MGLIDLEKQLGQCPTLRLENPVVVEKTERVGVNEAIDAIAHYPSKGYEYFIQFLSTHAFDGVTSNPLYRANYGH